MRRTCCKVRLDFLDEGALDDPRDVPGAAGQRQRYFSWDACTRGAKHSARRRHSDDALLAHIQAIHAQLRAEHGWPRMHRELLARGLRVCKERVRRLMQRHGIRAKGKRKFVVITDSAHRLPVAPDLVQYRFTPTARATWCGAATSPTSPPRGLAVAGRRTRPAQPPSGGLEPAGLQQTSLVKDGLADGLLSAQTSRWPDLS